MKRAKVSVPSGPAAVRKAARNSGDGGANDEPIYKALPMPTVAGMFKRILTLAAGIVLGAALVEAWPRVAAAWNFWPDRELARASSRVREVMRLVMEGLPNKLIADALDISVRTVEVHRSRVFDKLGVKSAVDLVNLMNAHPGLRSQLPVPPGA